jgi:NAD(P)-dependent dehydrogenase (short-subunit alcohol dehydrogenase family)
MTEPDTHITILDINPATGVQTLKKLHAEFRSANVSFEQCDVSSWESQAAVFKKVFTEQGQIDIVFANAGITEKGTLLPENDGDGSKEPSKPDLSTLNVNLVGVMYCMESRIFRTSGYLC